MKLIIKLITKLIKMVMYGNEANLKEALFKFKNLMDNHGIEFVLLYGALLGAYRNKRLLPWDADIDVLIIADSYEDFVNMDIFGLLRDAYKEGFNDVRWAHEFIVDTGYFKQPQVESLPKKEQWREFLRIDPNWKCERFGMHWQSDISSSSIGSLKERNNNVYIDCLVYVNGIHDVTSYGSIDKKQLGKIELYRETFNTPLDIDNHLSEYYGKNWRDVFCSYELWSKHCEELRAGRVPQEVEDFMNKWKPLLNDIDELI